MPSLPGATCYTLSCDELRLSVEFTLNRGEFGRIGSSPDMEISLPLVGLAEEECGIYVDDSGVVWLIREGKEQPVRLDPPSLFRVGPYRFLIREKVEANPTPVPLPIQPQVAFVAPPRPHRRVLKTVSAFTAVSCIAAALWFALQRIKSDERHAHSSPPPFAKISTAAAASETALGKGAGQMTNQSGHGVNKAEPVGAISPLVSDSQSVEDVPKQADRMDLELLARTVGPCVFRIEVIDEEGSAISSGTGFAVASDGHVATNFHVIEHGVRFALITQQGARFDDAQVVAEDPASDLAVLKIDSKDLPFLTLAKTSNVPVGKRVAVFGNPKGLGGTLSEGIISATPRDLKERLPNEVLPNGGVLLQTTAAVSPGSSGSPLFDSDGQVIGVISNVLQGPDQPQNLNFAVPVEALRALLPTSGFRWPFFGRQRSQTNESAMGVRLPDKDDERSEEAPLADPEYRELREKMVKQEWVAAMKIAGSLVEKYPKSAVMHFGHAYCASALRLDRQAELSYLKALEFRPNDHILWHNFGIAISNQNQTARALAAFERAVALKPDAADSWSQIVIGNVVLGDWPKATLALKTLDQVDSSATKRLCRHLSRFKLGDAGFRQAVAANLSKKLGNIAKDGPVRVRVIGVGSNDTLSIRSGPGAAFMIVTSVANGTELFITGRSEVNGTTEWVPVENGNWAGWVAARFLAPIE